MKHAKSNINENDYIILSTLINEKIKRLHLAPLTHTEKKKKTEDSSIEDPKTQDDIWVVQLPNLQNIEQAEYESEECKNKLYSLLKLFDQKSKVKDNEHRLRLIRKFFPGFLDRVIKRLQTASDDNPLLEEQMHAEDEYLQALIERDNQISYYKEQLNNEKIKHKRFEENR